MGIKRILFVIICLLTAGAQAQRGGPSPPVEAFVPAVEVESFIWQIPAKWYPYSKETDTKKIAALFPTGQKPTKYKESLTYTEFNSTLGATSADQVKDILLKANAAACTTHKVEEVSARPADGRGGRQGRRPEGEGEGRLAEGGEGKRPERGSRGEANGLENGYSTSLWIEVCEAKTGTQYTLNKVILGNEKLYTAQKLWKSKPKDSKMQQWQENLRQVYVCDPRTGTNACVSPAGPPAGRRGRR